MKKIICSIILLSAFIPCTMKAGFYVYVSPTGSDANDGGKSHPVASLEGAVLKIKEIRAKGNTKDTVFVEIQPGKYFFNKELKIGADLSPVVFRGQTEDRPLICGGRKAGRFEVVSPSLWRVYVPETEYGFRIEQLYINGQRRFRAQTPDRGSFFTVKSVAETKIDTAGKGASPYAVQKITLHDSEGQSLKDLDNQPGALAVFYHSWDNTRKPIQHISLKDHSFYTEGAEMKPWNPINAKSRYVIENYRNALNAPGEWFLDPSDGYLYYIPILGETPDNVECILPVAPHFLRICGEEGKPVRDILFENIRFEVTSYLTPLQGNEPAQAANPIEASIMLDYAENITFRNCDIAHTGIHGVWFRNQCRNSRVEHCHIYDLGGGGVKIGTQSITEYEKVTNNIVVHNNIIQHGGYVFPCAVAAIIFNGRDNEISHNDIADFRYSAVSVGWVWGYSNSPSQRNKIVFNHLHHLGWGELCDMGGVYTLGDSEGTVVSNNVIHHIYSFDYGGWGLYTDEGSTKILMENNLVYDCKNAGFHQHYGKENIIRNNIFAFNVLSQMQLTRIEEHLSLHFTNNIVYFNSGQLYMSMGKDSWLLAKVDIDRNCYWDTRTKTPNFHGNTFNEWQTKYSRDRHSVVADPLFVAPEASDFRFRSLSVAKKIGFKPFDYSKAGVYGDEEWERLAELTPALLQEFDDAVAKASRF
ncbi:MAG: right-handed parallel beta-helix repeat-containing protein [Dysgonamonadaceae bacterium]|jgi:parallel beta-helix repeat protein|nr:right-handed parallel beta-helix repeat-containing protein [Dysgonamonadaceae bacterium]